MSTSHLVRPSRRSLIAAAMLLGLLWTVVPALLQRDLQLDAIEGVAYGRDWQLSYWKHPPLPWLLMDITHRIFGARLWPFFLLGQLAAAVAGSIRHPSLRLFAFLRRRGRIWPRNARTRQLSMDFSLPEDRD